MLETVTDQQRAENTVRSALRKSRPGDRMEALTRDYAAADERGRDAIALALIARVALSGAEG